MSGPRVRRSSNCTASARGRCPTSIPRTTPATRRSDLTPRCPNEGHYHPAPIAAEVHADAALLAVPEAAPARLGEFTVIGSIQSTSMAGSRSRMVNTSSPVMPWRMGSAFACIPEGQGCNSDSSADSNSSTPETMAVADQRGAAWHGVHLPGWSRLARSPASGTTRLPRLRAGTLWGLRLAWRSAPWAVLRRPSVWPLIRQQEGCFRPAASPALPQCVVVGPPLVYAFPCRASGDVRDWITPDRGGGHVACFVCRSRCRAGADGWGCGGLRGSHPRGR